jgi:hypothetical protein
MGKPTKRSGEPVLRDVAILQWFFITLGILRTIILTSSMMVVLFRGQSFPTREGIACLGERLIKNPSDILNASPRILSAAAPVGAIRIILF